MSAGSPAAAALFLMLDISNAINFNLNSKEIKMHNDAIYLALNNSSNGEIVSWHSGQRLASGKARVIMTFHLKDEYCRTFQSYIKLNGAEKHETKTFCKKIMSGIYFNNKIFMKKILGIMVLGLLWCNCWIC